MPTIYKRITDAEREEISIGLASGETMTAIGMRLDRRVSTISREVAQISGSYRAHQAAKKAQQNAAGRRQGKLKLNKFPALLAYVQAGLLARHSPWQIAERIKMEYPLDMTMRISHEAVYRYVYVLPRGELKRTLIQGLRQERAYRRKQKKDAAVTETRGKISHMLSIEERPAEIAKRIIPGHWEGDLIIGRNKRSAVGTLVERTTRYTMIVPLPAKDATTVRQAFTRAILQLPEQLRKTLTYDQGKEMSEHQRFTLETDMQVYFAHPASPWERGTNENTNGLIRQYFPKGTDFREIPSEEIARVQRQLNGRPRKAIGYQTPFEAFQKLLTSVALEA